MILIALGASLSSRAGGPADTLRAAVSSFGARGITVESQSGFYLSPAWPDPTDPAFVNAVVAREDRVGACAELLRCAA